MISVKGGGFSAISFLAWSARGLAAAVIFLRSFFPPWTAATGLDPSWQVAITEASSRGLLFGRDIIFTFGPLGYLGIGAASPATYEQMLFFAVGISALLSGLAIYETLESGTLVQKIAFLAIILFCLVDVSTIEQLAWVFMLAWTLREFRAERASPLLALLLGLLSGTVLLVKFNVGFSACLGGAALFGLRVFRPANGALNDELKALLTFCFGVVLGSAVYFARFDYGTIVAAILAVGVFVVAILIPSAPGSRARVLAVLGAFGAIALALAPTFRSFFGSSFQVALGYSSAMSLVGARWELPFAVFIFVIVGLLLVANIRAITLPVAVALGVSLFFAYKEGFVRQDLHVIAAFMTPLFITGLVLRVSANRRLLVVNAVGALLALFALSTVMRAENAPSSLATSFSPDRTAGDVARFRASWLSLSEVKSRYENGLAPDLFSPILTKKVGDSTVDVEPWEAAVIFANHFNWDPEPIFQQYSAYTSKLDSLNAEHVYSSGAERVFLEWTAIDAQQPAWDQPAATRALLCRYAIEEDVPQPVLTAAKSEFLLLRRVAQRCGEPRAAGSGTYGWNQKIPVPASSDLMFMSLRVSYNPLGRLIKTLFRVPPVTARILDSQGRASEFRILTETMGDGILVGPFPQNLAQFRDVFENRKNVPRILSLELQTDAAYLFDSKIQSVLEVVGYR